MSENIVCNFNNTITERDMDMLLAESVIADHDFCCLLVEKTDLKGKPFKIHKVEVSKSDSDLGESDITIVIDVAGDKYGLLVEDKIDAIAMPEQHGRYIRRGDKGIKGGEYKDYRIFIFCPEKYRQSNGEAQKYEHLLTYEECKEYFDCKNDPLSAFKSQQLEQAINKSKRISQLPVDEDANAFLREYINYKRTYYPSLGLSTKEDKNGWWTDFRTELGYVYIVHKIQEGYVDLIFPRATDKTEQVKAIAEWLRHHGMPDVSIEKPKRSIMIRARVPEIDIKAGFEAVNKEDLNTCFDTIKEYTEFANMIETANSITLRQA